MLLARPRRTVFVCLLCTSMVVSLDARAQEPKAPESETEAATPPAAEPPATTPIAGYVQGEGFRLYSEDRNFKLRVGLQWAGKYEPVFREDVDDPVLRTPFYVARLRVDGTLFRPWLRFWNSVELAASPPYLLDSYIEIQPLSEAGLRLGQQFTPLSRHEYLGPQEILFPDWNVVAEYFWTGRDKGATFFGSAGDGMVEYFAGVYSGSPLREFRVLQGNWVTIGRVTVSPLGPVGPTEIQYMIADEPLPTRFSFSLQGWAGDTQSTEANFNGTSGLFQIQPTGERTQVAGGALDLFFQGPTFIAFGEAYMRQTEVEGAPEFVSSGAWLQVGVAIIDKLLDVGFRGSYLNPSDDLENDMLLAGEVQVAYYFVAPNAVIKLRYGVGDQDDPGADTGPVSLPAVPGTNHVVTLQFNIMF